MQKIYLLTLLLFGACSFMKAQHTLTFNIPACPHVAVSETTVSTNELLLYPNPSGNIVFINLPGGSGTATFYNTLGVNCLNAHFYSENGSPHLINVASLKQGLYFVHIETVTSKHIMHFVKL